jgi:hypothetical protein
VYAPCKLQCETQVNCDHGGFLLPKAMGSENKVIFQEPERKSSSIEPQFVISKLIRDAFTE